MFLDTCALYAFFFNGEKNHGRAKRIILEEMQSRKKLYYSDYVLDELLTLSRKRKNASVSNQIMDAVIGSELELLKTSDKTIAVAMEIFRKYEKLSFTDSTIVALMLENRIQEICSFDGGFDSITKIARIY